MGEENIQVVRHAFEAYFRGDLEAMLEAVDPEIVVTQLPDQPDFKEFHGPEGLLESMSDWIGSRDGWSFELREMREVDDRVLASGVQRGRGKGSGIPVEADVYFVFTLSAGKVVRWQMFETEQAAVGAIAAE
jgi:ketosteroid isomerase-like protein